MRVITVALCCLLLAACGSSGDTADVDTRTTAITRDSGGKLVLGGNSYLWQASLNKPSFMPLASADPFGGVIITNWYSAPDNANERMKVTVYILSRQLRADGLKIAVFRQTNSGNGWVDAQVNPDTATKLEDAILTRARELRLASVGSGG